MLQYIFVTSLYCNYYCDFATLIVTVLTPVGNRLLSDWEVFFSHCRFFSCTPLLFRVSGGEMDLQLDVGQWVDVLDADGIWNVGQVLSVNETTSVCI